jgi:hypothetical protein
MASEFGWLNYPTAFAYKQGSLAFRFSLEDEDVIPVRNAEGSFDYTVYVDVWDQKDDLRPLARIEVDLSENEDGPVNPDSELKLALKKLGFVPAALHPEGSSVTAAIELDWDSSTVSDVNRYEARSADQVKKQLDRHLIELAKHSGVLDDLKKHPLLDLVKSADAKVREAVKALRPAAVNFIESLRKNSETAQPAHFFLEQYHENPLDWLKSINWNKMASVSPKDSELDRIERRPVPAFIPKTLVPVWKAAIWELVKGQDWDPYESNAKFIPALVSIYKNLLNKYGFDDQGNRIIEPEDYFQGKVPDMPVSTPIEDEAESEASEHQAAVSDDLIKILQKLQKQAELAKKTLESDFPYASGYNYVVKSLYNTVTALLCCLDEFSDKYHLSSIESGVYEKILESLKIEALDATDYRGHSMSKWTSQTPFRASATCQKCGMDVTVDAKPGPNGAEISGKAVALNCENK